MAAQHSSVRYKNPPSSWLAQSGPKYLTVTRARPASDFYSESQDCDGQTFTSPSFGPTTQRTVCFMAAMLLRRAAQVRLSKATKKKGYLLLIYSFSSERFCHLWKSPEEKGKRFFFYLPRNIQHIIINYIANTLRQSPFEFFLSLNCTVLIYCLQEFFIYFFPPFATDEETAHLKWKCFCSIESHHIIPHNVASHAETRQYQTTAVWNASLMRWIVDHMLSFVTRPLSIMTQNPNLLLYSKMLLLACLAY